MPAFRDGRLVALAAATLAFARLAGGPLPWFLFYLSAGAVALALGWAWALQRSLRCRVALDRERLEAGQSLQVQVEVHNSGWLPAPWVEVDHATPSRLGRDPAPRQGVTVGPGETCTLTFALEGCRRGHYRVGPFRLTAGDGLGLCAVRREVLSPVWVTVYPRVYPIHDLPLPLGLPFGHLRTRALTMADPANLADIRPYRPGDSPRHIHWATSARRGELYLKEFELNAAAHLALVLDLDREAHRTGPGGETLERAVEAAASLAELGARQGFEVSLLATGAARVHVPPARGQRGFVQVLEALARVEADGPTPLAQALCQEAGTLPPRATVGVITPRLTPELAGACLQIRARHPLLLVVIRTETFGAASSAELQEREALLAHLAARQVPVYLVGAGDDLRRLAEFLYGGLAGGSTGRTARRRLARAGR